LHLEGFESSQFVTQIIIVIVVVWILCNCAVINTDYSVEWLDDCEYLIEFGVEESGHGRI
jgi:hypothetical protein